MRSYGKTMQWKNRPCKRVGGRIEKALFKSLKSVGAFVFSSSERAKSSSWRRMMMMMAIIAGETSFGSAAKIPMASSLSRSLCTVLCFPLYHKER